MTIRNIEVGNIRGWNGRKVCTGMQLRIKFITNACMPPSFQYTFTNYITVGTFAVTYLNFYQM